MPHNIAAHRGSTTSVWTPPDFSARGLRVQDAARYLGCTVSFVRSKIWSGELPALLLGKRYVLDRLDCDRFLEKMKANPV
jgi:excisionase family DNA binding protein